MTTFIKRILCCIVIRNS